MSLTKAKFIAASRKRQFEKIEEYMDCEETVVTISEIVKCIDEIRAKEKGRLTGVDLITYRTLINLLVNNYHPDSVAEIFIDKNDPESLAYMNSMGGVKISREVYDYAAKKGNFTALVCMLCDGDSYIDFRDVLMKYDFAYDCYDPKDNFMIALRKNDYKKLNEILVTYTKIANVFDDFAIKYVCEYGHLEIVKLLLACDNVDPSTENNYPIKIAKANQRYPIVLELLKHPAVSIDEIDSEVIKQVIDGNYVCIAERIFNEAPDHMIAYVETRHFIYKMLKRNNDVTLSAIKNGIIVEIPHRMRLNSDIEKKVKKQIKKYKSLDDDESYKKKSYRENIAS